MKISDSFPQCNENCLDCGLVRCAVLVKGGKQYQDRNVIGVNTYVFQVRGYGIYGHKCRASDMMTNQTRVVYNNFFSSQSLRLFKIKQFDVTP